MDHQRHKWFISNARRSQFAILIARTNGRAGGFLGCDHGFLVDIRRRAGTTCEK